MILRINLDTEKIEVSLDSTPVPKYFVTSTHSTIVAYFFFEMDVNRYLSSLPAELKEGYKVFAVNKVLTYKEK